MNSCETFTTEGFANPESALPTRTLPEALASARLDVTTATIAVAIRLRLNGFAWTMRTGRRKPGPDDRSQGRLAGVVIAGNCPVVGLDGIVYKSAMANARGNQLSICRQ